MWRHRKQFKALETAGTVAFGPVGIAGTTLPETRAYDELAEAGRGDPASLVPHLEKLVRTASPAGRVYAAEVLDRLDPAAGRRAWERLSGETGEFMTMHGCVGGRSTLAEYASGRLGD